MRDFLYRLRPKTKFEQLLLVFVVSYILVSSVVCIAKHYTFQTTAWDLGIYEQVLWSTVNQGNFLWYSVELPINQGGSFFGIHFSPILFLLLPIYWVFQSTESILILQSVFVAIGAVPLFLIAKDETSEKEALFFSSLYLLYPPLQGMNLFDFHVEAFLPAFFFSAFYFFKKGRWKAYFLFLLLSLMVIEFVPFITIFFGLYGFWTCRKGLLKRNFINAFNKKITVSILTVVISVIWLITSRSVLFHFNPSPRPHPNWENFGDPIYDFPGFVLSIVANPIRTIQYMFQPLDEKLYYIFGLFAPVGFMSFLSPPSLLIGAPWFLASLLANYPNYYNPVGYQWVGFVIPFIFISALYGSKRFCQKIHYVSKVGNLKKSVRFFNVTVKKIFLVMILMSSGFLVFLASNKTLPYVTYRDQILERVVNLIPSNASVLTQNDIFPHLSKRLYGYVGNNPVGDYQDVNFDYILVDTASIWYTGSLEIPDFTHLPLITYVQEAFSSGKYGFITAIDDIWLLKRDCKGRQMFPLERGVIGSFYDSNNSTQSKIFESVFLDTDWNWTSKPPFPIVNETQVHVIFNSSLYVPVFGVYKFEITGDGPRRLYIANNLVCNCDEVNICIGEVHLDAGFHNMTIEYDDVTSASILNVEWKIPHGESYEIISHENLLWKVP